MLLLFGTYLICFLSFSFATIPLESRFSSFKLRFGKNYPTKIEPSSDVKQDDVDYVNGPNIRLYYESLCPGCHNWINTQLVPTYQKLYKYMDFEFVPYGNAHQTPHGASWEFTCQHGPNECKGNIQQSCIVEYVDDQEKKIDIIYCIENSGDITSENKVKKNIFGRRNKIKFE